jgi:anti-anti-sigma regulatory factor
MDAISWRKEKIMNYIMSIKKLNANKFRHEITRRKFRQKLRKQKNQHHKIKTIKEKSSIETFKYKTEKTPDNFCMFTNTEECIKFFNRILKYILDGEHLYIDMRNVRNLDASAIIFFLSMFKNLKYKNIEYHIRGNVPQNANNLKYLYQTGFFNFVNSNEKSIEIDNRTLMIKESSKVENIIAKEICDFIIFHTKKLKVDIKPHYEMLIELMNNTKHHAYESNDYVHNWYLYCQASNKKVQIIFFDNGLGIPSTIRKNRFEEFTRWLNTKGLMLGGDIDMLKAALDGAFRTRTREKHRGKGLPMIMSLITNNIITNPRIITNQAFFEKRIQVDIHNSLQGTLYSWEVI